MPFNDKQIADLSAPLGKSHVKERSQAGRSLSYIEAWHAISEANRIFGYDAWNRETVELRELGPAREIDGKWRVGYMAKVRVTVGEIVREGCGFGSGIDRDLHQAHESALKEAESDAMKRALMTFGNPFGLALYDKTQANVEDDRQPANPTRPIPQSPAAQISRKTPAQAKRDGDDVRYREVIDQLDAKGVEEWKQHFDRLTAAAPAQWLDSIRDRLTLREEELEAEKLGDDLDASFRQTVGGPSGRSVSGHNGERQEEAAH